MGKFSRQIHIYVSLFFLPLALLYALSGVLFLCGFNQDSGAEKKTLYLQKRMDKSSIAEDVQSLLQDNHIALPKDFEPKKAKGGGIMYGTPAYSVVVRDTNKGVSVEVIERSFIGLVMLLHKGKAKWYFDVLAYGFALALVLLYVSGLVMANLHKIRKKAWMTVWAGFVIALVLGYLSVI